MGDGGGPDGGLIWIVRGASLLCMKPPARFFSTSGSGMGRFKTTRKWSASSFASEMSQERGGAAGIRALPVLSGSGGWGG